MIVLLSTSDTDLLSARASGAGDRLANPARLAVPDLPPLLDGATAVVVRILGGRGRPGPTAWTRWRRAACRRSCSAAR